MLAPDRIEDRFGGPVHVIGLPSFDPKLRVDVRMPANYSVDAHIKLVFPRSNEALKRRIRVTLDGEVVPPCFWGACRPKTGTLVVRVVPGNSALLRNVLLIAASVAAAAIGQLWLGPLIAGSVGAPAGLATNLISSVTAAALSIGASLILNALIPPVQPKKRTQSPTYVINGWQNQARPDGPVPLVLGQSRYAPPYFQPPYSEFYGDISYVTAGFLLGPGPVNIDKIKIGDTLLSTYIAQGQAVWLETFEGRPDDGKSSLCSQTVIPIAYNQPILWNTPVRRTLPRDCVRASIDIAFPSGLGGVKKETGSAVLIGVTLTLSVVNIDTGVTTAIATLPYADARVGKPTTYTFTFDLPERGKYDVIITKTSPFDDSDDQSGAKIQVSTKTVLVGVKGYRPEYPLAFGDKPMAYICVKMIASALANGVLDSLSAVVGKEVDTYHPADGTWSASVSRYPADIYRHVLTDLVLYPLTPEQTEGIEDWKRFCVQKGLTYNRVIDSEGSVLDVLTEIAAAGRATPRDTGTKWSVVIDQIKDDVIAHITARNSSNFSSKRSYKTIPDGFRVNFNDQEHDFQPVERVVPWLGHVGSIDIAEKIDMPGVTDPDMIWREARRRMREATYRPDTYYVEQDIEHLAVTRGDRVQLSHFVLSRTMVSSRVKAVIGTSVVLEDEVEQEDGQTYALRIRSVPDEDGDGRWIDTLATVVTQPGRGTIVTLADGTSMPDVGDLVTFGPQGEETLDCIVKEVEGTADMGARLTLVRHSPEIETETDAEVPPEWDGRSGGEIFIPDQNPLAPVIRDIVSGVLADQLTSEDNDYPVVVMMSPNSADPVSIASYKVSSRVVGAPTWSSEVDALGSAGSAVLAGYTAADKGKTIEVRARAVSARGSIGPYCDPVEHVIGATDPVRPSLTSFSVELVTGGWSFDWTLDTDDDSPAFDDIVGINVRYAVGLATDWDSMTPLNTGLPMTSAPWLVPKPSADNLYTFAAKAVDIEGEIDPPIFTYAAHPALSGDLLLDDEGDLILDDESDAILDGA